MVLVLAIPSIFHLDMVTGETLHISAMRFWVSPAFSAASTISLALVTISQALQALVFIFKLA
jgi:hypothetical protein